MIKRELAKDPKLATESWDRFLPKLPKKSLSKRWKPRVVHEKPKDKPLFPPPQTPRKIDLQMESGEYFLKAMDKKGREREEKKAAKQEKKKAREEERKRDFIPPVEEVLSSKKVRIVEGEGVEKVMKKRKAAEEAEPVEKRKRRKGIEREKKSEKKKKKKNADA